MTIAQHQQNNNRRLNGFVQVAGNFAQQAGLDLLAAITSRITMEGEKADGTALKAYTAAYLKFKKNPQNYKRGQLLGLESTRYSGKTDYLLTGRMLADTGAFMEVNGDKITVTIKPTSEDSLNKMLSLQKRDGQSPLKASDQEIAEAREDFAINLRNYGSSRA